MENEKDEEANKLRDEISNRGWCFKTVGGAIFIFTTVLVGVDS